MDDVVHQQCEPLCAVEDRIFLVFPRAREISSL